MYAGAMVQVVPNLVAGAIAEAGANQAGDMMQVFYPQVIVLGASQPHTCEPAPNPGMLSTEPCVRL